LRRLVAVLGVAVLAAGGAAARLPAADASDLIDRDTSSVKLEVNARGLALLTYRVRGVTRHVLAWGAINPPGRGCGTAPPSAAQG
jgi:hypothetical protein